MYYHSIQNLQFYPYSHYHYHYHYNQRLRTPSAIALRFHPRTSTLITTLPSCLPSQNSILPATPPTQSCKCHRRVHLCRSSRSDTRTPSTLDLKSSDVVRNFYDGINRRDLPSVHHLIALNCVYEDLVFPTPFVGRQAILEFFKQFIDSISTDLQFAIDDISEEDTSAVGVTWHLEWKGKPFPFSKGCSFYRLEVIDGQNQIVYGRDCVEPAIKAGETALVAIRGVTWLLQKFPFLADRL